jgi:hypothetical protein
VTNVDQPNFNGISAYAYLFKADLAEWYGPEYDASQPSRQLSWIQLYTGQPEPPGEGAEGHQALRFSQDALELLKAR